MHKKFKKLPYFIIDRIADKLTDYEWLKVKTRLTIDDLDFAIRYNKYINLQYANYSRFSINDIEKAKNLIDWVNLCEYYENINLLFVEKFEEYIVLDSVSRNTYAYL